MLILDTIDTRILTLLSRGEAHTSALSRALTLPRTTISFRLKRLELFEKVTSEVLGRKTFWRLPRKRLHNKSLYRIFEGNDFLECYKIIETLPRESVIYVVQGQAAAEAVFRHVPRELIEELHRTIKRKNIIMKGIANKSILTKIASLDEAMRRSHKGRPQSIKLVDTSFLSSGELFVTKEYIAILNPRRKTGVLIKDSDVISLFYDFAKMFFDLGERLDTADLNAFIGKTLSPKSES